MSFNVRMVASTQESLPTLSGVSGSTTEASEEQNTQGEEGPWSLSTAEFAKTGLKLKEKNTDSNHCRGKKS